MARAWSRIVWLSAIAAALLRPREAAAQRVERIPVSINPSPYNLIPVQQTLSPVPDAFPPVRPNILNRPFGVEPPPSPSPLPDIFGGYPIDPPLGYTGPSGILPRVRPDRDFVPMEDRWRLGFPAWDRADYTSENPKTRDYPYQLGQRWNPFNQNVLKGDYPIIGQHTFLNVTATSQTIGEGRYLPTPTTPFESTARPFQEEFFGRPNQSLFQQFLRLSVDLFHGDAAFKPVDWRVRMTPVFNFNYLDLEEIGVVSPDVTKGSQRGRTWFALEEYFVEAKLFDLSPEYDFVSARIGSQFFTSDFRGFIFSDTNRAVRLFGTNFGNRDQFNVSYFRQAEKDTNSGLNTFDDRRQNVFIGNYYRQDFIWPGYTIQGSILYDNDLPSLIFDDNRFLARPDPAGVFQRHQVDAVYFGINGDGHIDRYNISHAFYWAVGHDTRNPIGNTEQDINGYMGALELSYDRDWARFRGSVFFSSGDGNPNNKHAVGFDSILDNPNFAGGEFSFWQRQAIPLFGVNLVNRNSLIPDLRTIKIQSQANFVNPGLWLFNTGFDMDLTPKLRMINNANFLMFDKTATLEQFLFDGHIDREIGVDLSSGFEYRPLLSNNVIFTFGVSTLLPGRGFKQLYNRFRDDVNPLFAGFAEMNLTF